MIYREMCGEKVSLLGLGTLRLPETEDGELDEKKTEEMIDYAMANGINYFDTSYAYHNGKSEIICSRLLKKYPRDSYFLADKFPGHQPGAKDRLVEIFEEQMTKADVEYFDFFLLHNVSEYSMDWYLDEKAQIIPYLVQKKKEGKIKHLGFSSHAELDTLKWFVDNYGQYMDFCQIQLNWLDYSLQKAKEKYEFLTERGIPIVVMEPLRGGTFKNISESFRFVQQFPNIRVILSGMSSLEQTKENIGYFQEEKPLSEEEKNKIDEAVKSMSNFVPCTRCHYCDGCPKKIDIPTMMGLCNEARVGTAVSITMRLEVTEEGRRPGDCISCGACVKKCPQKINIPEIMKELNDRWSKMVTWEQICKDREEKAKKLRNEEK